MGNPLLLTTIVFLNFAMLYARFDLKFYFVNYPNEGFYCPQNGIANTYTTHNLCKLACIQSTACVAINYNISDSICTRMITPCPQANSEITMQYTLFSQRRIEECYQWRKLSTISPNHPRLVLNEKRSVIVSRLIYQSGYYPCYYTIGKCFGGTGSLRINSDHYVCELLLVEPRCTVGWLPFTAGNALPRNAASAGPTTSGELTYIVRFYPAGFPLEQIIGYYTIESTRACGTLLGDHRISTSMEILVVL